MKQDNKPASGTENIYEYIFENIIDGIAIIDAKTRKFSMINSAICRMLGYTKEDLLNASIFDIHPEEKPQHTEELFNQLLNKEIELAKNVPVLTKDGTVFYADIAASPMQYNDRPHLLATFRNITERKKAEKELLRSEELLRIALNTTADGILLIDNDGKISHINSKFISMWNIPQYIIDSNDDRTLISYVLDQLSDPAGFQKKIEELYNSLEEDFDEIRFKDGRIFERYTSSIIIEGIKYGRIWDFRDITGRKEAEETLKKNETLLSSILEASSAGICLLAGRTLMKINHSLCRITGYSEEELLGRTTRQLYFNDEEFNRIEQTYKEMERDGLGMVESRFRRKDGSEINALICLSPINPDDFEAGTIATVLDITDLKQTELALKDSEEKYRTLVDNMQDAVYRCDLDGTITFTTPSAARLLGYSSVEDVIGMNINNFYYYPEEREKSINILKKQGKVNHYEVTLKCRDNKAVIISTNSQFYRDSEGNIIGIEGVYSDITELKHAEKSLRESEERFRSIINSIPIGIHIFHLESSGQLVFDGANPAADKITGINNSLFIGKTIEEAFPALTAVGMPKHYREAAEKGISWHSEQIVYDKKNSIRKAYDVYAFQIGHNRMVAAFMDITNRKQAEEGLKNSEAVLKSLFNATPIGISLLIDSIYVKVNDSLCRILGYSEQELLGQNIRFLYPDENEYKRVGIVLYGQMEREGLGITESRLKRKDGGIINVILCLSPFDAGNISAGVTLTALDITEQKKMEAEKSHLEEMLLRAQKMEAIGTMAGGIAHDFNNILSGIFGYSELSLTVKGNPPDTDMYIREIIKASERARDLISSILTFSRQTEPLLKPVMPKYIIKEAVKLLRASTPTAVELKAVLKSESAIIAEPTLLHQVILNLCNNAIHAMQSRPGIIEISLEDMEVDREFVRLHPGIKPGKHIILRVSDTGSGIKPEILDRIFDPFFTTKSQTEGTGLGLSVVHGIVKKLNGIITVYSKIGKGTVFNIIIPAVDDENIEFDRSDSIIKGGTESILLVDDEEAIIKVFSPILDNLGYKVKAFTDCREALDEFRNNPDGYDIIITDYSMPHMTGLEMAINIKEIRKDIPIILSSGFLNKAMEESSLNAKISVLLTKPVSTYQLADAIRRSLSSHQTQ